jgi:dTDP-glucose 4,6-dehydratase
VDDFSTGDRENIGHLAGHPLFSIIDADISVGVEVPGQADLILHFASPASPKHYTRLPLETLAAGGPGTLHTLQLAHSKGARFILASTSEVYGDPLEHPQREVYWGNVNPVGPRSMYDEAKRYAEALTTAFSRKHGLSTGIARIFNTYGPRLRPDDGRAVPNFIRQATAGQPMTVYGDGSQTRSLCYVDDTVLGIFALARSEYAGPVNIGAPEEITVHHLAVTIRDLVGSRSDIKFLPAVEDDPRQRRPDISVARRELSWAPRTSLDEGLRRTIISFTSNDSSPPVES